MEKILEGTVKAVKQLPYDELKQFRACFEKFDVEAWDEQIDKDIKAGKLDNLSQTAISDHHARKSKKL